MAINTDSTTSSGTRGTPLDTLAAVRAALTQLENEFSNSAQPTSALAHTGTRATACHASVPGNTRPS